MKAPPNGRSKGMRPAQFDARQLRLGTKHEMEHTSNRAVARRIAMDHLAEDPRYYDHLEAMEASTENTRLRQALRRDR